MHPMFTTGRIPSLDGFRTLAILLVIVSHLVQWNYFPATLESILTAFSFGLLGVRLFFIISGFLITYLLLKEREKTGNVRLQYFYVRRFLRIFPVFYLYLLVIAFLNWMLNLHIPFLHILSAGLYIQNIAPWGDSWFIGHSWSLAVEEQFYILWPTIFQLIRNLNKFTAWIIVLVIGSGFRCFSYKYPEVASSFFAAFLMHVDFLFSGCFMAFLVFHKFECVYRFVKRSSSILVYFSILAILFLTKYEYDSGCIRFSLPVAGTLFTVLICFLLLYFIIQQDSWGYKFLNCRGVSFIGKLSYSIYIWQQLFINNLDYWWTQFPQNIGLTLLTACLSYQLIEKPFLRIKDKFHYSYRMKVEGEPGSISAG